MGQRRNVSRILRRNLLGSQVPFTRLKASLLILSILLVSQGCTDTLLTIPWSPHLKEEARTHIHTIEVVVDETLPRVTLEDPYNKASSGAGRTAWQWSKNWIYVVMKLGGYGIPFVALTPVAAALGAVAGATEVPSAETVQSQEAQIRKTAQIADLLQRLEKYVRVQITDRTDISLASPQGQMRTQASPQDIATPTGVSPKNPVLTIRLLSLDLRGRSDVDPSLALHLNALVTLASPTDAIPVYSRTFQYVGQARPLTRLMEEDAKVFHAALELSLARLAELIVDDIFLTYPFAHEFVHRQQ
jgi:hypothetical protein